MSCFFFCFMVYQPSTIVGYLIPNSLYTYILYIYDLVHAHSYININTIYIYIYIYIYIAILGTI